MASQNSIRPSPEQPIVSWAYVAGYFDGEGHVSFTKQAERITFTNTHLESLEKLQAFIGCGILSTKPRRNGKATYKPCHQLRISRRKELLRILPCLMMRCIVKREELARLYYYMRDHICDESPHRGGMLKAGIKTIESLYWKQNMSQSEIAKKYRVCQTAVSQFMRVHGIPCRSQSVAGVIAKNKSSPERFAWLT